MMSQSSGTVPVSATIGAAVARCQLAVQSGGVGFGALSLPGDGLTGTATIDVSGASPTIGYVDNASPSNTLPSPSTWAAGTATVTAYNTTGLTVTATFPSTLAPNPQITPPASLSYTGSWAAATDASGPFTVEGDGTYTASVSGASVQRFFRFGGVLSVPNTSPLNVYQGSISIETTCTAS